MAELPQADPRLVALIGGEELAWLRRRVRDRLARRQSLTATVSLRAPSVAQRAAVRRLLGGRMGRGEQLTVPLPEVSAALARAGLATDVGAAVVALDGPVVDLVAQRAEAEAAWAVVGEQLQVLVAARPELEVWVRRLGGTGLVRSLAGSDVGTARRLVEEASAAVRRLPADDVPLARFAHDVLGDAHALDADRAVETLARGAAEALAGPPTVGGAEGRRETWAAVGILVDDLTSQVLCLGLPGGTASAADRLLGTATEAGEPVALTLGMLARHPPHLPALAGAVVSVCENVTVLAAAAAARGPDCAPLVCTRGQPTVAVLRLLGACLRAGARLRYHGDFDWPGLRIAGRVIERTGAASWRFGAEDYRPAAARGGPALRGPRAPSPWDHGLATAMRELGVKVEEEAVLDDLLADL